jgi:hypothetical protein
MPQPTPILVCPTKAQLGYSQYIATCYHLNLVIRYKMEGAHPDYRKVMEACSRLAYGRLAIEMLGGDPNAIRVYAVEKNREPLIYRTCDDPDQKIVLVRLEGKPPIRVVGWTRGRIAMEKGQPLEVQGYGEKIPSYALADDLLNPILDVSELRSSS